MKSERLVMMLMLSLSLAACRRSPESRTATQLSNLATTPEQARLWREAADQGLAPGLQKLEQTDRPVQSRQHSTAPNTAVPAQGASTIPASVTSAVRIMSTAGLENADFSGPASVTDVDASGERISLDLGNKRTIAFQARVGGRALTVKRGDTVTVEYRVRNERFNRRQILAVRALDGSGIARITETGPSPVKFTLPLFGLVATQATTQPYTSVDVRVGNAQKTVVPGEIAQIGGMTVGLLASSAVTGPEAKTLEGSPYAIELIAWSSR